MPGASSRAGNQTAAHREGAAARTDSRREWYLRENERMSNHDLKDRVKALDDMVTLYTRGEISDAFEILDSLLQESPDDPDLRLIKAEWSAERRVNAAYVGQTARLYRALPQRAAREDQVIRSALAWAEATCSAARRELAIERPEAAVREFRTACEVAPWDASIWMARAFLLLDYVRSHPMEEGDASEGSLSLSILSARRDSRPITAARLYKEVEIALGAVRERLVPKDPLWRDATLLLAEVAAERGNEEMARMLLAETGHTGAGAMSASARLHGAREERMSDRELGDLLHRSRQLMRRGDLGPAGELLAAALKALPDHTAAWLALADWFLLRRNLRAAEDIYRWILRGGAAQPQPVDTDAVRALVERAAALHIKCRRCHRSLDATEHTCPVCGQPIGEHHFPTDTYPAETLAEPQDAAMTGLIEALMRQDRPIDALELVHTWIGKVERKHPALPRLGELMAELEPKAMTRSYEMALQGAIERIRKGDSAAAQAALSALFNHPAADARPQAWQAIALTGDELCPEHRAIIRRAVRVPAETWAQIPVSLRHRLVSALMTAGWLPEARDLLGTMFSGHERDTKKVRILADRCQKLIRSRCDAYVVEAQAAIQAGYFQEVLSLVDSIIALEPDHPRGLLVRGEAFLASEMPYAAAADFRAVLAMDVDGDTRTSAVLGIARTYEQLRDLPEAARTLDMLPPDLPEVRSLRAHFERQRLSLPAVRVIELDHMVQPDTLRRSLEDQPVHAGVFAIGVRAAARWREEDRLSVSRKEMAHVGHEFIATLGGLSGAAGHPTFELRLIAEPNRDVASRGALQIAILCRVTHPVPEGAEHMALELWDKIRAHLPMAEQYVYQYEPIYDEEELSALLEPFEIRDASEVVRRAAYTEGAYALQIFTSGMTSLENLAWTLLRQDARSMVNIRLHPTHIQPSETAAFKENLDRLRRVRVPKSEDEDGAESSMEEMARTMILPDGQRGTLVEMVGHLAQALEKQAFVMSVTIASEERHSALLSHAVAAELFGPGGRYEVVRASDDALEVVRRNTAAVEMERWVPLNAPRRLARMRYLVTELEAGWTFRLPMPGIEGIPGMPQMAVKAAPPTRIPAEGIMIGESAATIAGVPSAIRILQADRRRHTYVIGKTGVGKSTLLETMALQDIAAGRGVMFLDPHGDSVEAILSRIPPERADDVILFDPADSGRPIGVNFLQAADENEMHRIAAEFVEMLIKMYDPHHMGIAGPIFQHTVRMGLLTAMMALPEPTLVDVVRILTDEDYGKSLLPNISDPLVRIYWEEEVPRTSQQRKGEVLTYIVSKFNRFTADLRVRNIIGQSRSALDFRRIMDEHKILLVSLSKGKIGPESAEFLGFLVLQSLLIAALSRADRARDDRTDYCLYVDEFQTFATESFAALLSEGRKYGMCLVMANQYLGQLTPTLREAVFGNVGTMIAFQVDAEDGHRMAPQFYPVFGPDDLINMPKYTAAIRLMVDGQATRPFALRTRLSKQLPEPRVSKLIREMSRMRYGRNIDDVNREIGARFKLSV